MVIGIQWIIFIGIALDSWLVQMNLQTSSRNTPRYPQETA